MKLFINLFLFLILIGIVIPLGHVAHADDWQTRLEVKSSSELAAMNVKPVKNRLQIRLLNPDHHGCLEFTLQSGFTEYRLMPKELFDSFATSQIATYPSPELTGTLHWVTLQRMADAWLLSVDDQMIAKMPPLGTAPCTSNTSRKRSPLMKTRTTIRNGLENLFLKTISLFPLDQSSPLRGRFSLAFGVCIR